jgi:hypothetical protein
MAWQQRRVMAGQGRGNVGLEGCSRGDDVEKVLGGKGETMEGLVGWGRVGGNGERERERERERDCE